MDRPPARPESTLIRLAREAAGMSIPEAASASGVSKARWSQVETGYETRGGITKVVTAKPGTLARMAAAIPGLTPERLESEGQRPDAAKILAEILRSPSPSVRPVPEPPPSGPGDPAAQVLGDLLARYPDDQVVQAMGAQHHKPPRVRVNEILQWLERAAAEGSGTAG